MLISFLGSINPSVSGPVTLIPNIPKPQDFWCPRRCSNRAKRLPQVVQPWSLSPKCCALMWRIRALLYVNVFVQTWHCQTGRLPPWNSNQSEIYRREILIFFFFKLSTNKSCFAFKSDLFCMFTSTSLCVMLSLTHLPLVPHICISELGQHWFN